MRLSYYVGHGSRPEWMATELVYPVHREDRVRLVADAVRSFPGART